MTERDDLAARLDALETRLDRVIYLLVALLVLQSFHVLGGSLVRFSLLVLFALVAAFVLLVVLGLARSF